MRKIAGFSNGIAAASLCHVSASHWSNGTIAQLNDDAFSVLYFFLYVIKKKAKHNFISRKLPSHKVCAKKREKEKNSFGNFFLRKAKNFSFRYQLIPVFLSPHSSLIYPERGGLNLAYIFHLQKWNIFCGCFLKFWHCFKIQMWRLHE